MIEALAHYDRLPDEQDGGGENCWSKELKHYLEGALRQHQGSRGQVKGHDKEDTDEELVDEAEDDDFEATMKGFLLPHVKQGNHMHLPVEITDDFEEDGDESLVAEDDDDALESATLKTLGSDDVVVIDDSSDESASADGTEAGHSDVADAPFAVGFPLVYPMKSIAPGRRCAAKGAVTVTRDDMQTLLPGISISISISIGLLE